MVGKSFGASSSRRRAARPSASGRWRRPRPRRRSTAQSSPGGRCRRACARTGGAARRARSTSPRRRRRPRPGRRRGRRRERRRLRRLRRGRGAGRGRGRGRGRDAPIAPPLRRAQVIPEHLLSGPPRRRAPPPPPSSEPRRRGGGRARAGAAGSRPRRADGPRSRRACHGRAAPIEPRNGRPPPCCRHQAAPCAAVGRRRGDGAQPGHRGVVPRELRRLRGRQRREPPGRARGLAPLGPAPGAPRVPRRRRAAGGGLAGVAPRDDAGAPGDERGRAARRCLTGIAPGRHAAVVQAPASSTLGATLESTLAAFDLQRLVPVLAQDIRDVETSRCSRPRTRAMGIPVGMQARARHPDISQV